MVHNYCLFLQKLSINDELFKDILLKLDAKCLKGLYLRSLTLPSAFLSLIVHNHPFVFVKK